jgi:hypothetical protein
MAWARFSYICRKASAECREGESVSEVLSRIEKEDSCDLYGDGIPANSWPGKLLMQIGSIKDSIESRNVVETYGNLNLTQGLEEPMRLKRVTAYLGLVVLVFYSMASTYRIFVIPQFIQAFEDLGWPIPSHLTVFWDYWWYLLLLISVLLIASLIVAFRLKRIFRFYLKMEGGFVLKYLAIRRIRRSYKNLIEILQFPILSAAKGQEQSDTQITAHLRNVKDSDMNLAAEMQELIDKEQRLLVEGCERQVKSLLVVVALLVVATIYFFLGSAYSPIFMLGEAV